MVYAGEGSYHYWGYESLGYKAGDTAVDQSIGFNEAESFEPSKGQYTQERRNVYSNRMPKTIFTSALEPGEGSPGPMVFKDPFQLLSIFTHRTVSGMWAVASVAEISTVVAVAQAGLGDEDYFTMQGIDAEYTTTDYAVWLDKAGDSVWTADPTGFTNIRCDISGDVTDQDVSDTITAAINAVDNFGAANGVGTLTTVTITNVYRGSVTNIVDVDSTLVVATTTPGVSNGQLKGDFTDIDDALSIWVQYHVHDQASSNHLNRLLTGGEIVEYKLSLEATKLLMEDPTIKTVAFTDNTKAMSLSNDFHDQEFGSGIGGFSEWDNSGLGGTGKRSVADILIHLDDSLMTGLDIQSGDLIITIEKSSKQTTDSLEQTRSWNGILDFTLDITGALNDLTDILEQEKIYSNKTLRTLKFIMDSTPGEMKFIKVTNVYVDSAPIVNIPANNEIVEGTLTLKPGVGSAISYQGNFENLPDPTILVPTT